MFEDGFDEQVRAAVAAGDLDLDVFGGNDDCWASLTAEELAWAHDVPVPPSLEEVLAAGQREPVTAELVVRLERVDPVSLDEAGRVAYCVGWQRVANAALARRAQGAAAVAEVQVGGDWADAVRMAATELAAALALGTGAADVLASTSTLLVARLPRTLAAARRGDLCWEKVVALAQATAALSDGQARAVEDRVLPFAARRTPAQHRDAVRRAVDRIDPEGAGRRRRQARADIRLIATHHGSGMGELFAALPSEQLEMIWTAADHHARAAKAAGDPRGLDELRVAALVAWAESSLTGTGTGAGTGGSTGAGGGRPTRHGRAAVVRVLWDLSSLLGVTGHCGELAGSGATLPPAAMRELLARGARVRRMLIDPDTGELVDLTPCSWILPPVDPHTGPDDDGGSAAALPPVQLGLILDTATRHALLTGDLTGLDPAQRRVAERVGDLLPYAEGLLPDLLAYPLTADRLDGDPDAERPAAALAEFVAVRDRHPVNPCAGPTDAAAADIDHTVARSAGGKTVRDNLACLVRRWHIARTHTDWTYQRVDRHWEWTSPAGRTYQTNPYDYRLGP